MKAVFCAALSAAILLSLSWSRLKRTAASDASTLPQTSSAESKPPVYVSDFQIDVELLKPVNKPEEDPRKQASRLVELMSTRLVAALQKAGYQATRMHPGDSRPDNGVGIRGLFAEVDNENHWRRAVIRTATESGRMQALVALSNLAKPDQALYEIANLPGNEDKPGAVITLSPYVPLTKYDLSKDANEDVFKTIAPRVVNDLTEFLSRNPSAVPQ